MVSDMRLIERALIKAMKAHAGVTRHGSDTPYVVHVIMVGLMVQKYGFSDAVVAAGILHDIVEDTPVTLEELEREFGDEVAMLVRTVSHRGDDSAIWRAARDEYLEQVVAGPEGAKAISVADKIHNIGDMVALFEKYGAKAHKFFGWKSWQDRLEVSHALYDRLATVWHHPLLDEYAESLKTLDALAAKYPL